MRAEERTDGHSGPEFCLDGADLRVFCRRVHIDAIHLDRHAATPSHAHDGEATEDLILNRVYGKLFHRPAAADAEIISVVHAAADRDLAVRVE